MVLDIGGRIGAIVLDTAAELAGAEVEIRGVGREWDGTHVAVQERRVGAGSCFAAVFDGLPAGGYELRLRHRPGPVVAVTVSGGSVARETWPPD